jgi:hypothetical protein
VGGEAAAGPAAAEVPQVEPEPKPPPLPDPTPEPKPDLKPASEPEPSLGSAAELGGGPPAAGAAVEVGLGHIVVSDVEALDMLANLV